MSIRFQVEITTVGPFLTAGEARARRAYEAAKFRYARGLDSLENALSAEQAWRATRSSLTSAKVQGLRRVVQAYKALGGGWPAQSESANAPRDPA
jgi:outer membrane protein TolC